MKPKESLRVGSSRPARRLAKQTHDKTVEGSPEKPSPEPTKKPATDRNASFTKKDANHDNKLTLVEYLATQDNAEAAKKRFAQWDTNKVGKTQ